MCLASLLFTPARVLGLFSGSYAVFEYLDMGGGASSERSELMGAQLARMHRRLSSNGMYGFDVDNTIGGLSGEFVFALLSSFPLINYYIELGQMR